MRPLTVTAHLTTPPILDHPLMLDSILWAGVHAVRGARREDGWAELDGDATLPLESATAGGELWWWACSHVKPEGPEAQSHLNRVPLLEEMARHTDARSFNQASGPDKRIRLPYYYRPGMLQMTWTCVGDAKTIAFLLSFIPGVGKLVGHGHGSVVRWEVQSGGPELDAYGRDPRLRHLPALNSPGVSGERQEFQWLRLRPPYYLRTGHVQCLRVW